MLLLLGGHVYTDVSGLAVGLVWHTDGDLTGLSVDVDLVLLACWVRMGLLGLKLWVWLRVYEWMWTWV